MGLFFDRTKALTSQLPYRNYDAMAICAAGSIVLGYSLGFKLCDALNLTRDPVLSHYQLLIFDYARYKTWVIQNKQYKELGLWGIYLIPLSISSFLIYASSLWAGRLHDPIIHVRGPKLKRGKDAIQDAKQTSQDLQKLSSKQIEILPSVWITSDKLLKSILLVGAQGGGKTQIINHLLTKILLQNHKVIAFDPTKGDYISWLPERVLIAPTDRRTANWHLGYDITSEADAQAFSEGLIIPSDQPFFSDSARQILTGAFVSLINNYGKNWSWGEVADLISDMEKLQYSIEQYYPQAYELISDLESKTTQSIIANLITYSSIFFYIHKCFSRVNGKKFSFVNFILNDNSKVKRVVFGMNQRTPNDSQVARALVNLLTRRIASLEFSESKTRKIAFVLDEVVQFGRIENLAKLNEIGRSKGVYTIVATQDFSQLKQVYSLDELQKWDALFGLKIYPQIVGADGQQHVIKSIGSREVQFYSKSSSGIGNGTINTSLTLSQPTEYAVLLPSELALLGKRKDGIEALWLGYSINPLILKTPFCNPPTIFKNFEGWSDLKINKSMLFDASKLVYEKDDEQLLKPKNPNLEDFETQQPIKDEFLSPNILKDKEEEKDESLDFLPPIIESEEHLTTHGEESGEHQNIEENTDNLKDEINQEIADEILKSLDMTALSTVLHTLEMADELQEMTQPETESEVTTTPSNIKKRKRKMRYAIDYE